MKLNLSLFLLFYLSLNLFARNPLEPTYYAAPPRLAGVSPEMNTAGYWIARHPYPDSLIMTSKQISKYSSRTNPYANISSTSTFSTVFSGSTVKSQIKSLLSTLSGTGKYDSTGAKVSQALRDSLRRNANIDGIPLRCKVRFGFPITLARQRLAPGIVNLNKEVLDIEFDEMQNSGYDIGTPTMFYHTSKDGKWVYGACATSIGWYLKSEVCFLSQTEFVHYLSAAQKVVSLKARADIWTNAEATKYLTYCRMGTAFPLLGETELYYRIQIPVKDSLSIAYIAKEDARIGFLPYTPRNVYKQAFKMLNMPYGWGDTEGDYDCSSLIQRIFASFGISIPRNGLQQAKATKLLHSFGAVEKEAKRDSIIINKGIPAISLLRMNGHIMLYIGETGGKAYALHDTWGFRKPGDNGENEVYVINRTVVSDLYLSKGSKKGSLLSRLTHLTAIR
ncbi:MAG: hypothetical protein CVU50_06055 [Candidatus Cloacimonetes bacterium HGW-Cloacimonetes-3]|jgi:hypothetical protein|nr:MAG: hypothetical protein CVU50_06055 [Candidatus Cloacimonetes bacterium HGW-Cloacimonetes-3]